MKAPGAMAKTKEQAEREQRILEQGAHRLASLIGQEQEAYWKACLIAWTVRQQVGEGSMKELSETLKEQEDITLPEKRLYRMCEVVEKHRGWIERDPERLKWVKRSYLEITCRIKDPDTRHDLLERAHAEDWTANTLRAHMKGREPDPPGAVTGAVAHCHHDKWPALKGELKRMMGTGVVTGYRPLTRDQGGTA